MFAFTILGALYGFWIGKRAEVSGFLEGAFVFVTFVALANIAVWIIEKKRLPPNSEKKNDDYWGFAFHDGSTPMLNTDPDVITNIRLDDLRTIVIHGCINAVTERLNAP